MMDSSPKTIFSFTSRLAIDSYSTASVQISNMSTNKTSSWLLGCLSPDLHTDSVQVRVKKRFLKLLYVFTQTLLSFGVSSSILGCVTICL